MRASQKKATAKYQAKKKRLMVWMSAEQHQKASNNAKQHNFASLSSYICALIEGDIHCNDPKDKDYK